MFTNHIVTALSKVELIQTRFAESAKCFWAKSANVLMSQQTKVIIGPVNGMG
jgi:hypothetical protein